MSISEFRIAADNVARRMDSFGARKDSEESEFDSLMEKCKSIDSMRPPALKALKNEINVFYKKSRKKTLWMDQCYKAASQIDKALSR